MDLVAKVNACVLLSSSYICFHKVLTYSLLMGILNRIFKFASISNRNINRSNACLNEYSSCILICLCVCKNTVYALSFDYMSARVQLFIVVRLCDALSYDYTSAWVQLIYCLSFICLQGYS